MTEYLRPMSAEQKKGNPRGVRFDPETDAAISALMTKHGVAKWADYIRGLVYLDAHISGHGTRGLTRPGWVSRSYEALLNEPPLWGLENVTEILDRKNTKR